MKLKSILTTITIGAASLFTANAFAQDSNEISNAERHYKDSVETATMRQAQLQTTRDETRMADAKLDRKQTKANAKKAQRVENDANDAARESRYAVRSERRAQKARKQANKQAEKASQARQKSDRN